MPTLASQVRPSSEPPGTYQSPFSPTKATADPDDGTVGEASRSTGDQDCENTADHSGTSSDSDASRENVVNSDMETASRDCVICSDTDEVIIRMKRQEGHTRRHLRHGNRRKHPNCWIRQH